MGEDDVQEFRHVRDLRGITTGEHRYSGDRSVPGGFLSAGGRIGERTRAAASLATGPGRGRLFRWQSHSFDAEIAFWRRGDGGRFR